jgi:hypothetical protein
MSADQIRALVLENLKDRTRGADIQSGTTTLDGVEAVSVTYRYSWKDQPKQGLEYAFVRSETLFHLIFVADESPLLKSMSNDFEQVVKSLTVDQKGP